MQEWPARGALFAEGRWNPKGFWIIYCSESVSLAKLEILANTRTLPKQRVLVEITLSNNAPIYDLSLKQLPDSWTEVPYPRELHALSKDILQNNQYVALTVPSRQSPTEKNYLLYPPHPQFQEWIKVERTYSIDFDTRLK